MADELGNWSPVPRSEHGEQAKTREFNGCDAVLEVPPSHPRTNANWEAVMTPAEAPS